MRRLIISLLFTFILLTQGCGKVTVEDVDVIKDLGDDDVFTIMLTGSDDLRSSINTRIEAALEQTYPDMHFEFIYVKNYWDHLRSMNAMGTLPDVFFADSREIILPLIETKSVLDLRPYLEEDHFLERYKIDVTITPHNDGGIYSVQSGADTYFHCVLFYNKAIFDANAIPVPATWEAFYEVCEMLLDKGYDPLVTPIENGWGLGSIILPQYITTRDAEMIRGIVDLEVDMAQDSVVLDGVSVIERIGREGYMPRDLISQSYLDVQQSFLNGEAAMYAMYSWAAGPLSVNADIDIMNWPSFEDGTDMAETVTLWGSPYSGYMVSSATTDPEVAVEIAELMAYEEAKYFNGEQKMPTSLETDMTIDNQPYLVAEALRRIEEAEVMLPSYKLYIFNSETNEVHSDLILNIFAGNASIEDYMREFKPVWDSNVAYMNQ